MVIKFERQKNTKPGKTERTRVRQSNAGKETSIFGFGRMSRTQAVMEIKKFLRRSPSHTSARQLISLFNIHPEELAEAGVPYEILKVLEKRYCI